MNPSPQPSLSDQAQDILDRLALGETEIILQFPGHSELLRFRMALYKQKKLAKIDWIVDKKNLEDALRDRPSGEDPSVTQALRGDLASMGSFPLEGLSISTRKVDGSICPIRKDTTGRNHSLEARILVITRLQELKPLELQRLPSLG